MGMYIVVVGNPIEGLRFYGPFKTAEEAVDYGDSGHYEYDWWIAALRGPDSK